MVYNTLGVDALRLEYGVALGGKALALVSHGRSMTSCPYSGGGQRPGTPLLDCEPWEA